jgi:hypothetical protein
LFNFVDRPGSPAIKDNRDAMAFVFMVAGQLLHKRVPLVLKING